MPFTVSEYFFFPDARGVNALGVVNSEPPLPPPDPGLTSITTSSSSVKAREDGRQSWRSCSLARRRGTGHSHT
jgi:hypothetical protein